MKATGIIRRIDDLGRIVIPKEIRRTLKIKEGAPMELYIEQDAVIFKKYQPFTINEKILHCVFEMLKATTLKRFAIYDDFNILKAWPGVKETFPIPTAGWDEKREPFIYQENNIYPIIVENELIGYLLGQGEHSEEILKIVATYIKAELNNY